MIKKLNIKKLFALFAAVSMVFGLSLVSAVPAHAAEGDVTVTAETGQTLTRKSQAEFDATGSAKMIKLTTHSGVDNDKTITYTIYKVFGASANGTNVSYTDPYSLLTNPIYNADNEASATAKLYKEGTNVKYATRDTVSDSWADNTTSTTMDDAIVTKIGNLATSKTESNKPAKIGTVAITGGNQSGYVEVTDYGYYYVTSTTGSLVALTTTNKNATITDKNDVPIITKTENESTNDIGDTVTYTVTITAKKGTENLAFHDTLSDGLTLNDTAQEATIKYTVGTGTETTMTATLNDPSSRSAIYYTKDYFNRSKAIQAGTNGAVTKVNDNIAIRFNGTFTDTTTITIQYTAIVNVYAVVNEDNNAYIQYGHNHTYESTPAKVYESTFKFKVAKVDGSSNALSGAKFAISTKNDLGDITENKITNNTDSIKDSLIKLTSNGTVDSSTDGSNYIVAADDKTTANQLTINGLDADSSGTTYYLYEVTAPEGYNKLTGPIAVKITPTFDTTDTTKVTNYKVEYKNPGAADFTEAGTYTVGAAIPTVPSFNVVNTNGTVLPSTGGIGTTIFYVVGAVVIAGAVVLIIKRKKSNAE